MQHMPTCFCCAHLLVLPALDQVDLLIAAKPKLVLGTPVDLAEASQLHALLQEKEDDAAELTGELQRLTVELREERARSAQLQAKVSLRLVHLHRTRLRPQ